MTTPLPSNAQKPQLKPATNSPSEDAFHTPPVASNEAPEGPDVSDQPGAEAGHYGMGYGDPTRHQGGDPPAEGTPLEKALSQPAADAAPLKQATGDSGARPDPGVPGGRRAPAGSQGGQQ